MERAGGTTAAAGDRAMTEPFLHRRDIQICGIASAVPEHCIDQAVARDIILARAPEFRSHPVRNHRPYYRPAYRPGHERSPMPQVNRNPAPTPAAQPRHNR